MQKSIICRLRAAGIGLAVCIAAAVQAALPQNVSEARWLWSEPAADPPTNAYLRLAFEVTGSVKQGWFHIFADKACTAYVNGQRVHLTSKWPKDREKYFGHVIGVGTDLKPLLKAGRNVLAFQLLRYERGCYGLILRGEVEQEDGRKLTLFSNPRQVRGAGVEQPGWNTPDFDDADWRPAWSQGDVRMGPWSAYGNVPEIYMTTEEYETYRQLSGEGFPEKLLLSEPESPNARIVYSGETPGIEINGGRILPPDRLSTVDRFESSAQDHMLAEARRIGLAAFEMGVNNTHLCGDGSYDFTQIDRAVRHVLSIWPEAYVFFGFHLNWMMGRWLNAHPEEAVGYAVARPDRTNWGDYSGNPRVPSFASPAFRGEIRRFILELGDFCRRQPWGRRVLGMHDGYGGSGDGMPWGCHSLPDTGLRMTEAFRRFLTAKYSTNAALQKSWNDPAVTLATAEVPDAAARPGSGLYVRDLADGRDQRRADFLEAYHREFNAFELHFCRSVKEAFPGRLAGCYYGYIVLSYESEGSTARFEELLANPNVDYMKATTRGYNLTDGLHRHLHSVFRRYGKLSSIEGDVRTHVGFRPGQAEAKWCCRTPDETRATVAKFAMNARLLGAAWHSVDFGVQNLKWFDCPEALDPMKVSLDLWRRNFAEPPARAADVAVVFDPAQVWREGTCDYSEVIGYQDNLVTHALQTLNYSGHTHDLLAPEDYVAEKRAYKAVVFLNTCHDTPMLRTAAAKARRDGSMSIWCATPALSTPAGYSAAAMHDVTGIALEVEREPRSFVAQSAAADGAWDYVLFGRPKTWKMAPRVCVVDPEAEKLATWTDDGTTAFARKRLADGTTSVFLGMPFNRATQWAALLAAAGSAAYTPPGFYVRRDARHLLVSSGKGGIIPPECRVMDGQIDQSGRVKVCLGRRVARVVDVLTGQTLATDADTVELVADGPRTWMLDLEPK
jgi:hypothetical protein